MFLMFSIADAVSDKSVVSVRGSVGYSRFYYANCKGIRLEDISKPRLRMRILYPRICNALTINVTKMRCPYSRSCKLSG